MGDKPCCKLVGLFSLQPRLPQQAAPHFQGRSAPDLFSYLDLLTLHEQSSYVALELVPARSLISFALHRHWPIRELLRYPVSLLLFYPCVDVRCKWLPSDEPSRSWLN